MRNFVSFGSLIGFVGLLAACSSGTTDTSTPDASPDGGTTPPGATGDAGGAFPFTPSNVALPSFQDTGDVAIASERCDLSGDERGFQNCTSAGGWKFAKATLADGSEVALLAVRSLRVNAGSQLLVSSTLPIVIVAEKDVNIQGSLVLETYGEDASGGGGAPSSGGKGGGPGGGNAGDKATMNGGGGGLYCGKGGAGGGASATKAQPGATYGKPELVPLQPGSAGGNDEGGRGGGAVQIVAGGEILIGSAGVISAPGEGGGNSGGAGGSGGAILLEASTIKVLGTLAANGGGGNVFKGLSRAQQGNASATRAPGIEATAGSGGAGVDVDGTAGSVAAGDANSAGAGGGGVGRIRLNTASGAATIDSAAVVSPALTTPCATQGTVKKG